MTTPRISIIIPIHNAQQHLQETIESIQNQSFDDFEVICIDDDSADGSSGIVRKTAEKDDRFILLHQKHAGAGAARNRGLVAARGDYMLFLDSSDVLLPDSLKKLVQTAVSTQADIVACNYMGVRANGKTTGASGVYTNRIPGNMTVFSHRDCPDFIMQVISPMVWNKLYRSEFIRQRGLKFDELFTCNDISFAAVSAPSAERIAYVTDVLVRHRIPGARKIKNLNDVYRAVESAVNQLGTMPQKDSIQNSVSKFVVQNYIGALKAYVTDFSVPDAAEFYRMVHERFNSGEFRSLKQESLLNNVAYREFCTVQKHGYETMKRMIRRRLVVSLTSYPARIGCVPKVLESIYAQTRKADEILLWLAEEQFPGKMADVPEQLLQLVDENRLTIRWCDDLKPHKKYFYAFREYRDDLIITIDDDLLYPEDMLEVLHKSYLLYPNAVSALRTHLILVSEDNRILPYNEWIHETDACIHEPCMQLMATGGAGTLYPPELFREEFFDREAIRQTCLRADDLWLKAMQLQSDVPVVVARPYERLRILSDSQSQALYATNVDQNHNDVQLQKVCTWLDEKFGSDCFVRKLTETEIGTKLHGIQSVSHHLDKERKGHRWRKMMTEDKLKATEQELQQSKLRIREIEKQLRQAEADKAALQALASISGQYRKTGEILKEAKAAQGSSVSWCFRYVVYCLAWIPEKLLIALTYCAENGLSASAKRLFRKLFRR